MTIRSFRSSMAALLFFLATSCGNDDPVPADAPRACFTAPETLQAKMPLTFTSDCSANAASYLWDFGDDGTSTEPDPVHTFAVAGKYTVTLTVKNQKGEKHSTTSVIEIDAPEITVHMGDINANETWQEGLHLVFGFVTVRNATVTIMPGAVVFFSEGANLEVGTDTDVTTATLIANGTSLKPILFTADSDAPTAGFWDHIIFGDGDSGNSVLRHCTVEYGGGDGSLDAILKVYGTEVTIENSTFRHSAMYGLSVESTGSFKSFTNNTVSDCANASMYISPAQVHTIGLSNTFSGYVSIMSGSVSASNAAWKKLNVHYRMGVVYVGSEQGTTLTLEPGTIFQFSSWISLHVGTSATSKATLIANGTASQPITFTSADVLPSAGDWESIKFGAGTNPLTSLKYCNIEYGGLSDGWVDPGVLVIKDCSIIIENTRIADVPAQAITMNGAASFGSFINNTIEVPGQDGVVIHANWAHTLGTGNTFDAARGIVVKGGVLSHPSVTWLKQPVPYIIEDRHLEIYSDAGSMLTIEPGTTIKTSGNIIWVGAYGKGGLVANGTAAEPIIFSSSRATPQKGDWNGIRFTSQTLAGSLLNHCVVEYAGYYSDAGVTVSYTDLPSITNSTIRYSASYGIELEMSNPTMSNNTFVGNDGVDVY